MATREQIDRLVQQAQAKGLDPYAVIAVAQQEGLGGDIGDSGTSFGPFQLHVGGAFPWNVDGKLTANWTQQQRQDWAWSDAGFQYALNRIAGVAYGEHGQQAVHDIVYQFERPRDPGTEYSHASGAYSSLYGRTGGLARNIGAIAAGVGPAPANDGGGGSPFNFNPLTGFGIPNAIGDAAGGVKSAITAPFDWVKSYVLRGLLILLGIGVVLMGLYLIVRAMGAPAIAPLDKALMVATRGGVKSGGSSPRRAGDAAASRGQEVTRTSRPEPTTRGDRRQLRKNAASRERAASERTAARDAAYGEVPF